MIILSPYKPPLTPVAPVVTAYRGISQEQWRRLKSRGNIVIDNIFSKLELFCRKNIVYHGVYIQGKYYSTGTILKRKCIPFPLYDHYGILLGLDRKKNWWILEKNVNGVQIVSLHAFLAGRKKLTLHSLPRYPTMIDLLKRAAKASIIPFSLANSNCEAFVNYVVFGKHVSLQANDFKKGLVLSAAIVLIIGYSRENNA